MRFLKRISFLMYSCLLLGAGFYAHIQYEAFFYPNRAAGGPGLTEELAGTEAVTVSVSPQTTTCDTLILWRIARDGEIQEVEEKLPIKYVGLDRESFLRLIQADAAAPPLSERQKGFASLEVLRFSPEKIEMQKTYRQAQPAARYALKVADNLVAAYEEESGQLYLETRIDVRGLPQELRAKLLEGTLLLTKAELDNFLESFKGS